MRFLRWRTSVMSPRKPRRMPASTRREAGQALVLFAAGLAGMLALVGLAVDVGQVVATRTDLQKVADAAVMAGAQDLPSSGLATSTANSYVFENGGADTSATVTISQTYNANDTIKVEARRQVNYTFLRVIGLNGTEVKADATARVGNYSGGSGLLPWGFIASNNDNSTLLQNSCYLGNNGGQPQFKQNQLCTVKYGAGTNSGGDFGALSLDGNGANVYRNSIANGSTNKFKVGDQVNPETGNMVGPTSQGLSQRFAKPVPSGCAGHDRDDVLKTNADGTVSIRPGCEDSPRIGIIPVVDKIHNPQNSTILGFAFIYLHGLVGNGGSQQVQVEFVSFVTELPDSDYSGSIENGASMAKLIE